MPFQKCSVDGKSGWKWGEHGHCYTGPDGKKKADEQRKAIETSKHAHSNELLNEIGNQLDKNILE